MRAAGRRRRATPSSAFFQETTDDDDWAGDGRQRTAAERATAGRTTAGRPVATRQALAGPAGFPATRSVLWDRRALAEPAEVAPEQLRPRFALAGAAAKQLLALRRRASASQPGGADGAPACFVRGEPLVPSQRSVRLEQVVAERGSAQSRAGGWWIPVHFTDEPGLCSSKNEYVSATKAVLRSYADECSETPASRFQPRLLVSSSSEHEAQLDFQLEYLLSPIPLTFSLIRNLPLLMTPLAASLAQHEFGSTEETRRFGYLTLDRTRKAVPLLKMDPLVLQQPVVGIWVYGINLSEEWDGETVRAQLADPYLYLSCLHYLCARSVKERVGVANNTFLVAIYPSADTANGREVSPLPRFFECSFPQHVQVDTMLPIELFSHQKSCFAGLERYASDTEMVPTMTSNPAWEEAKQVLKIPVAQPSNRSQPDPKGSDSAQPILQPDVSSLDFARSEAPGKTKPQPQEQTPVDHHDCSQRLIRARRMDVTEAAKSNLTDNQTVYDDLVQYNNGSGNDASSQHGESFVSSKSEESMGWNSKESQVLSPKATPIAVQSAGKGKLAQSRIRRSHTMHDPADYRSCCKSQQLLAIQHQQILENQQRQLQEMQEQIVQLRKLLEATSKARQESEQPFDQHLKGESGYASSIGIATKDNDANEESHRWSRVGSELSRVSASLRSLSHAVESAAEGDDAKSGSSLSSLELSSLSEESLASDEVSSLSSSSMRSGIKFEDSGIAATSNKNEDSIFDTPQTSAAHAEELPVGGKLDDKENQASPVLEEDNRVSQDSTQDHINSSDPQPTSLQPQDDDASAEGGDGHVPLIPPPRLLLPDAYLQQRGSLVDHHGGCFTAPTPDLHSFCVPRIRFSLEGASNASEVAFAISDSEDDDDLRLIEQKYRKLMAA